MILSQEHETIHNIYAGLKGALFPEPDFELDCTISSFRFQISLSGRQRFYVTLSGVSARRYTISEISGKYKVFLRTARADLLLLEKKGKVKKYRDGKRQVFMFRPETR